MSDETPTRTISAGLLLRDGADRIFMVKQKHKAYWDLPGGIIEPMESPIEGLRRELEEELGIDVAKGVDIGRLLGVQHFRNGTNEYYAYIFTSGIIDYPQEFAVMCLSPDVEEYRWMSLGQIVVRLAPHAPKLLTRLDWTWRVAVHDLRADFFLG